MKNNNNTQNNTAAVAKEIFLRAINRSAIIGINPAIVCWFWNDENSADENVRKAIIEAEAYAKEDADSYTKISDITAAELYDAIDKTADELRNEMVHAYFEKMKHTTCFEMQNRMFHVIGSIHKMEDIIIEKNEKTYHLVKMHIMYENKDQDVKTLRLDFWDDKADKAMAEFHAGDIICANGQCTYRHGTTRWFTNYTVNEFSMYATAIPAEYVESPKYQTTGEAKAARNYSMQIWGRRGHYRRSSKGNIHYVNPCICHRQPAFAFEQV